MGDLIDSTGRWFADVICGRARPSVHDIEERYARSLVAALGARTLVASLEAMAQTAQLISGPDVTAGSFRVEVSLAGDRRWEIRCQVDEAGLITSIIEGR